MTASTEPATGGALHQLLIPTRAHAARPTTAEPTLRLRRGLYVPARVWQEMSAPERLRLRAYALDQQSCGELVFSHRTAAALWGLPIIGAWPTLVEHVTPAGTRGRSPGARRRRTERLPRAVLHDGVRLTSAARTVVDLAREERLESALAAADLALSSGLCDRTDLQHELDALPPGARGRRKAGLVLDLADPLSESVGESLSRARMYQLDLPRPRTQVRLYDEEGEAARVDFWWEELQLAGEFDGFVKYQVPETVTAREASEILWREKRREDRIRAGGRRRVGRWTWADALDLERFRTVMARLGVHAVGASTPHPPAPRGSLVRERLTHRGVMREPLGDE